ncbi:MAG: glycosyltransferase family 4 protein [Patescibacteria group bacterium]|nr:glycosyltransferase family 4 protein [Patescibacteria group bacterium]
MKIAQIVCAFPPYAGGIGQSAYRLGEILSREHQVSTFTLAPAKEKNPKKPEAKQKIIFMRPYLRSGHGAFPIFLPFRLLSFDLIYLHYPFFGADALILLLSRLRRKQKLIIHYHMDTPALPGLKKILALPSRLILPKLVKKAEKIIVSSRDYADSGHLAKTARLYPEKIKAIPFGVETDIFRPKISSGTSKVAKQAAALVNFVNRRFIKRGGHTLLFVGGLDQAHYFKGLNILLQAMKAITSSVTLNIIGTGELKAQYEEEAKSLGLSNKVNFLGRVSEDDLIRQYQNADLLILPSINEHEAFGLVLIEAMACGVPIIASRLPGVRSVFEDDKQGYFCEPGNTRDLAEKIDRLCQDENKRQAMGKAARSLAEDKYGWEKIADQILDEFSGNK